jgi:hypothetical protein
VTAAPPVLGRSHALSPSFLDRAAPLSHSVRRLIPSAAPAAAVLAIVGILVGLGYGMNHTSYAVWGGFWVAPVLLILSLPVANRAARLDGDEIGRVVLVAAGLKVIAAPLARYWMAYGLYGGVADATLYHSSGSQLAPLFRQGIYGDLGQISGTRFIEVLTGQVYAFTGPTRLGGFMIFSWLSFLGLYLFYRAFRTAYPDGDGRRYALLIFFFPSLLFWPSSIGKEAFMLLVLGAASLGAAQLFAGRLRGLAWLALGMGGAVVVRPHMALILGAGLVVAAPLAVFRGGARVESRLRGRLGSAMLVVALLLMGSVFIGVAEQFFGLDTLNAKTAQEQFDEVTRRSGEKGSTFTTSSPNNPVGFALSGMTVLFRPLPFEVRNAQALVASGEGLALLAFCALSIRRLRRLPLELLRRPYVTFSLVYVLAFTYAFSSIANFGILARQRVQLLPIVFVVLCLPRRQTIDPGVAP